MPSINILQVENLRDNAYLPNKYDATRIVVPGMPMGVSQHATEVRDRIDAGLKDKGVDYRILHGEMSTFVNKRMIGSGRENVWYWPKIWPKKPTEFYSPGYQIVNISAGTTDLSYQQHCNARLDEAILRDNLVVAVGLPNKGQEMGEFGPKKLFSDSKLSIAVGCTNGNHHNWPTRSADVLAPDEWTSWNAPHVTAVAARLIAYFIEHTGTYDQSVVKHCIKTGVSDRRTDGVGVLSADLALGVARSILGR